MPGRNVTISNQAIHWFVRLHSGDCTETERRQFSEWLIRDNIHRREYQRVAAMWTEMDGLNAAPFPELDGQVRVEARRAAPPRLFAMAALLLVTLTGLWLWSRPVVYQTARGERQTVTLADGSTVDLNTDTALSVWMSVRTRRVTLERGEALFTVAHEAHRPFLVQTGVGTSQALGTAFNVYKKPDQVVVTVFAGSVQVTTEIAEGAITTRHTVVHGHQLAYTETGHLMPMREVDVAAVAAWRDGRLIFDEAPLAKVITEIARYHASEIRLADAKLQDLKISGVFNTDDWEGLLRAIAQILRVTVNHVSEGVIVLAPAPPTQNPAPVESSPHFRVKPLS